MYPNSVQVIVQVVYVAMVTLLVVGGAALCTASRGDGSE